MKDEDDDIIEVDEEKFQREYQEEVERLYRYIELRKEMIRILKIAQPPYIAETRKAIAEIDKNIEATETLIELQTKLHEKKKKYLKDMEKLGATAEIVLEGLREYLADDPEKLAQLEASLSEGETSH